MRVEIEVRMRCCWCRATNFATWLMPESQRRPTSQDLDAFTAQQVSDFVCKGCGGPRGVTVAIYRTDEASKKVG